MASKVDRQVAAALKNLLRGPQQKINQLVEALPSRNAPGPQRLLNQTHTTDAGLADRLGFKRAQTKNRSDLSLCDIAAQRSDAVPGRYTCVECGRKLGDLMEAWRTESDIISNFSTLFCEACAMKLNQAAGLRLAPIRLSNFDKLNMGQFVPEFGTEPRAASDAPAGCSKMAKWSAYLTGKK